MQLLSREWAPHSSGEHMGHMAAELTTCTGEHYVASAPCSPIAFALLLFFWPGPYPTFSDLAKDNVTELLR